MHLAHTKSCKDMKISAALTWHGKHELATLPNWHVKNQFVIQIARG